MGCCGARLAGASLLNAHLYGANLQDTGLRGANLQGTWQLRRQAEQTNDDRRKRELEELDQMAEDAVVIANHHLASHHYSRFRKAAIVVTVVVVATILLFARVTKSPAVGGNAEVMQIVLSDPGKTLYAAVLGEACVREPIPAAIVQPSPTLRAWPWTQLQRTIVALPSARCRGQPRTVKLDRGVGTLVPTATNRP